jgi:hypothetical protein
MAVARRMTACEALAAILELRRQLGVTGHQPGSPASAQDGEDLEQLPEMALAWQGRAYLDLTGQLDRSRWVTMAPRREREYDLTTNTVQKLTVFNTFVIVGQSFTIGPNPMRRAIAFAANIGNFAQIFPGGKTDPNQTGIWVGANGQPNPDTPNVINFTDRDWGGWVTGPWGIFLNPPMTLDVYEDIYLS